MVMIDHRTAGRSRPQGSGFELFVWYFMRITGVMLFVLALAHFSIMHFLFDPSQESASWIAARWGSLAWRVFDWTLLMAVLFHGFMGLRTVLMDYVHGARARLLSMSALYIVAIILFAAGTGVVMTLPVGA
ncbi:MAG: succinate dehydrogenase, hydrophobic membrane anchor protein [Candidatus Limnocylindrales bacterium]|jgi:succinate dehydrogenase / fumarate reductase membrane anchor subunit